MATEPAASFRSLSYPQARVLSLAGGVVIVGVLAGIMWARHVEPVEIFAVLLFLPVFAALLVWDAVGGAVAGAVAALGYVAVRWSAIRAVGFGRFSGLIASRVIGLVAFGVIGGLANRQLRFSLTKLDLYDQIDDATGLFNARFMVAEIDLEVARSTRYQTIFGVSVVDIPAGWFASMSRRPRERVLRELGRVVAKSVRTVDRAAHVSTTHSHRIAVLLPQTATEGCRIFTERLTASLTAWLSDRGVAGDGELQPRFAAYPESEAGLAALRAEFDALDQAEHRGVTPAR
jgi:hypothetical protein